MIAAPRSLRERAWNRVRGTRVNPLPPAIIACAGFGVALSGRLTVGGGIAAGAVVAYLNGVLLARRIDVATLMENIATAMLVMQAGLLVSLTLVAVVTILLIQISATMAIASAGGFAAAHLAILFAFYWTYGRSGPAVETRL